MLRKYLLNRKNEDSNVQSGMILPHYNFSYPPATLVEFFIVVSPSCNQAIKVCMIHDFCKSPLAIACQKFKIFQVNSPLNCL